MRKWIIACTALAMLWTTNATEAASPTAEVMAQQVATSLRESGELSNYRVGVKYQDGTAWLLGTVTSEEQAQTAVRLASKLNGVDQVVSKLQVVAPAPKAEVTNTIQDAGVALATLETNELVEMPVPSEVATPAAMPTELAAPERIASRPMPRQQMRRAMPRPMRGLSPNGPPQQQRMMAPRGQQRVQAASYAGGMASPQGYPAGGPAGVNYEQPNMPNYAWPSYAAHPNYAAVSYPKQYSASAWPYIGPFHPYPQVPLGWRKVTLEWDDGWWNLDFSHHKGH